MKPLDSGVVPVNGLQMSISRDAGSASNEKTARPVLTITFRNLTSSGMALLLGSGCAIPKAIGRTMGIKLNITGPDGKHHRNMPFLGDGPPYGWGYAGELYVSVVTLQPGASKSFQLDLDKYLDLSDSNKFREARFSAGTYSL